MHMSSAVSHLSEKYANNNVNDHQHFFAICEFCFWTVTILQLGYYNSDLKNCPSCYESNTIFMIPFNLGERGDKGQRAGHHLV